MQQRVALAFFLALLAGQSGVGRAWETDCNAAIPVEMVDSVDSGTAYPGMLFRFKVSVDANLNGTLVPANTIGYGYVRSVSAASNRDRNGSLILEPREVVFKSHHIQVIADPLEGASFSPAQTLTERASGYVPIPGIVRTAVNEVRDGKNITIGPGYTFHVIALGDPRKTTPCRKVGQP